MSNNEKTICHEGIVEAISEDTIQVKILSQSACVSCQVKGACSIADSEEKIIDVPYHQSAKYFKGQHVSVEMSKNIGNKAVLFSYLFPFLIMFITLLLTLTITSNEGLSALIAILILIPYFIILNLYKDHFKKSFQFKIQE